MCVQCLPCLKAPAGSSTAVPSTGWWELLLTNTLPARQRLSVTLPCNFKWLFNHLKTEVIFSWCSTCPFTCVLSEEEGEEEEEETEDGEGLGEVQTESSGEEEEEEEVEEEGAETAAQPPQKDPEAQSAGGEPLAEPTPAPELAAPAGQVNVSAAPLPCQLC